MSALGSREPAGAALSVFFHTNRLLRPAPVGQGFAVRIGWYNDSAPSEVDAVRRREGHRIYPKANVAVQCDAAELRRRFEAFGAPLVVSAENAWWPQPSYKHGDPWVGTRPVKPWPSAEQARHLDAAAGRGDPSECACMRMPFVCTCPTYPNSGLMMGTAAGVRALARAFDDNATFPRFPCCPRILNGTDRSPPLARRGMPGYGAECLVNEQHCVHSALQSGRVPHALDTNSSLFLNLAAVPLALLRQLPDGRFAYRAPGQRTPSAPPCVLHFNGQSKIGRGVPWGMGATRRAGPQWWAGESGFTMSELLARLPRWVWVVEQATTGAGH